MTNHKATPRFSAEVRERAVRIVLEHRAEHTSPVGGDRLDRGQDRLHGADPVELGSAGRARPGPAFRHERDERERIKALERENRELRQANEILRKASAYFAQAELDRLTCPLSSDHA